MADKNTKTLFSCITYVGRNGVHMKELNTTDIRNVVILGGSGSGKTTLTEAAAFASGKINRLGSVLDGEEEGIFNRIISCSCYVEWL